MAFCFTKNAQLLTMLEQMHNLFDIITAVSNLFANLVSTATINLKLISKNIIYLIDILLTFTLGLFTSIYLPVVHHLFPLPCCHFETVS